MWRPARWCARATTPGSRPPARPRPGNPEDETMATVSALSQSARKDQSQTELHRQMLRQMLLIRRFEEKAAEAYALGKIGGFCHLYIGQEAVAVGSQHPLGHGRRH